MIRCASGLVVCAVRAADIEVECRSWVDAFSIGLEGDAGFGGNADVYSLVIEAATEFRKSAVAAVLYVIGGQGDGVIRCRRCDSGWLRWEFGRIAKERNGL